ncbi:MAG TPA: NADH-quinone oxidoreductase subunit L [Casimicrobiaceae bacterium]|nr:NADH-quinone oxidoreductase subunit L [Casimicrobiaceae bacterium]
MQTLYLVVPLAPLFAAIVVGLWGSRLGRRVSHSLCIAGVGLAMVASIAIARDVAAGHVFNGDVYTWLQSGSLKLAIGLLIDPLTVTMMVVVTFVSLMVHVYTIGYMADDPGYTRFFSYISLFTFSMLMLVMSNNFLQLFFGWEAVGLVSYLLIGFWYTRPTAIYANLKAFLANRVGDFGFVLGIGLVLSAFGTLDYAAVFARAPSIAALALDLGGGHSPLLITAICIGLFVGAMGKSAQVPLHVWLPDSMEGPTPISALIHAATMVTAGIFMVARMSPLFELSDAALSFVTVIGATTALFMAFLGIVQNDIKRVVAYSTLSQLGYMTVALGVSAYSAAIFHLMTHAFFKALLFLAAGSVIVAMHHEQDLRRMGGLRKYMPITWITTIIGSLALAGIPPFAGFFSKDAIIEAVAASRIAGHSYAYFAVVCGVFVTAFYSFRMLFLAFHGAPRFDSAAHDAAQAHAAPTHAQADHDASHEAGSEPGDSHDTHGGTPHESPWVITVPLILLAIPSVYAGWHYVEPMLFGDWFGNSIVVSPAHPAMAELREEWHGVGAFIMHGFVSLPFWLAIAGIAAAFYCYIVNPALPARLRQLAGPLYTLLDNKYYFDRFNDWFFAGGTRELGEIASNVGDRRIIDGFFVNGSARAVGVAASILRKLQSGYVYQYAFTMIIGVFALLTWWVVR